MKSPMIFLLGLIMLLGAPAMAQETKETESTQGVEKKETTGQVGEATGEGVAKTAEEVGDEAKKTGKAGKMTAEQRKCAREVAKEMGQYRERQAQLKRAEKIGREKNNQELLDKVAELRPKLESQHEAEMNRLRKTYGEANVKMAHEAILNSKMKDGKGRALNDKGKGKAKGENQKVREGANKGAKKRKAGGDA